MKEKLREFFAKHRHLIVIALIIAVILAALTPLVVPLGLELEDRIDLPKITLFKQSTRFRKLDGEIFESYTIRCEEHPISEEQSIFFGSNVWTRTSGVQELCTILNEAPMERNTEKFRGFEIMKIWLHWRKQSAQEIYSLIYHNGRYSLQGTARNGETVRWYISEESARELKELCSYRAEEVWENPRAQVCDAENIASASFLAWAGKKPEKSFTLTREQIETLCDFLEDELLPARYSRQVASLQTYPIGQIGWQVRLVTQDEVTWLVQYNDEQCCLSLCCVSPDTQIRTAAGYHYRDEAVIAALPQLLEEVP